MRRSASRVLDEYLACSARAGDRSALELLAERWSPRLLGHAYRLMGDTENARDAAQDAWADIVRGLPRLKDAALFPSWAFRIVTRRCADSIRQKQRMRQTLAEFAVEPRTTQSIEAPFEVSADVARIRKALPGLPKEQHVVIALFYLEELSVAEVAAALSVPAGTVKTRLMHARKKLRAELELKGAE